MLVAGVILILAIFTILGWRKGVIRIILSLASIVITIIAAVILAPICTSAIKNNTDIDEKNYIKRERTYGIYKREFYVGNVDYSRINAKYKDGVLYIEIYKKENDEDKKTIEIK